MLRFCSNLTTMYGALPLPKALAAAKADGFDAVECRSPFDLPAPQVRRLLDKLGMTMVQFNCPMGNYKAGDRGLACVPGRETEFMESITRTIEYARALNVRQVNCVGGVMPAGTSPTEAEDTLVSNLRYAAPRLADAGIRLQIEPINAVDTPGVYLSDLDRFSRVYERVNMPNLWLQYDFYHMQMIGTDLMSGFDFFADIINHVQIADCPGRHEPGTGSIDYKMIFTNLSDRGYTGWVGCEYVPLGNTRMGMGWMDDFR